MHLDREAREERRKKADAGRRMWLRGEAGEVSSVRDDHLAACACPSATFQLSPAPQRAPGLPLLFIFIFSPGLHRPAVTTILAFCAACATRAYPCCVSLAQTSLSLSDFLLCSALPGSDLNITRLLSAAF